VTVGRFRQFVAAWDGGSGYAPLPGSGKHAHLNGGLGLEEIQADGGTLYESGWNAADDTNIAPTDANLACYGGTFATWTPSPAGQENLPINCVNWFEAFAFCIWDGGFLPSEAEWGYAAAGGGEQREYPWGSTPPGTQNQRAIYGCYYPGGADGGLPSCMGVTNLAAVGTAPAGTGAWGQLDLAGDVFQWIADYYAPTYPNPCTDCAALLPTTYRVVRGGSYNLDSSWLGSSFRAWNVPSGPMTTDGASRIDGLGFRCARTP